MAMLYNGNFIGQNVSRLRCQNDWTQAELVAKLRLLGCCMTRDILANIETCHSAVTDKQIKYFAEVFGCEADEIFQQKHPRGNKADRQPMSGLQR
jgi:transcriptional regulator with XRE-family HTH domain